MNKTSVLGVCILTLLFGCGTNYNLEKKSGLDFSNSFYTEWNSPVNGGGSGFNIYLLITQASALRKNELKIEGIYFKNSYSNLKAQKENFYQAFIGVHVNESISFEQLPSIEENKEKSLKEKIPFVLNKNEAIVVLKAGERKKYVKITLKQKETLDIPM